MQTEVLKFLAVIPMAMMVKTQTDYGLSDWQLWGFVVAGLLWAGTWAVLYK